MNTPVKILGGLVVLMVLAIGGAFLLPSEVHVERSIIINSSDRLLFNQINDLQNRIRWSPLFRKDPKTKVVVGNPYIGEGASYTWSSDHPEVSSGKLMILDSQPGKSIMTKLDVNDGAEGFEKFTFERANNGYKVTWGFDTELGASPMDRFQGLFIENARGSEMEQGLKNLREACESQEASRDQAVVSSPGGGNLAVEEIDFPGVSYVAARKTINFRDIEGHFANFFPLIYTSVQMKELFIDGPACALFYNWDEANNQADVAAAIPVKDAEDLDQDMKAIEIPAGKAVMVNHYGPVENISQAHLAIQQYMQQKGFTQIPPIIEEYVTNPEQATDPSEILTRVYCLYQ
ncbi:MAG: GyrI-like domain-containing protein [Bacteroidota bacterium]